jgi:hypothetical protein
MKKSMHLAWPISVGLVVVLSVFLADERAFRQNGSVAFAALAVGIASAFFVGAMASPLHTNGEDGRLAALGIRFVASAFSMVLAAGALYSAYRHAAGASSVLDLVSVGTGLGAIFAGRKTAELVEGQKSKTQVSKSHLAWSDDLFKVARECPAAGQKDQILRLADSAKFLGASTSVSTASLDDAISEKISSLGAAVASSNQVAIDQLLEGIKRSFEDREVALKRSR